MVIDVDIVIVAWRSEALTRDCLDRLARAKAAVARIASVTVIDNSALRGREPTNFDPTLPFPLQVIANPVNVGFAAACNQGARHGRAPLLLFLNPDIEVMAETIDTAARVLIDDTVGTIGIVGARLTRADGASQRSCARLPTPTTFITHALGLDRIAPRHFPPHFLDLHEHVGGPVGQVMGAFTLMRRRDWERIGGWDEQFFLYMEDVDLAARIRAGGQSSWYCREAVARHLGGGTTAAIPEGRLYYLWRSRIVYARKHFGMTGRFATALASLIIEPLARIVISLIRMRPQSALAQMCVTGHLWRSFPFRTADSRGAAAWLDGNERSPPSSPAA